jgi:hypothetical protein
MWLGGPCSTNGGEEERGKPEGKRPLGRWMYNIRIDLGEVGLDDVDWIG